MGLPRVWRVILTILLAVISLAFLLGVRLYIDPRLYWRDLWSLLFCLAFTGTSFWLTAYAPWSARFFALGFVLGAEVEIMAGFYLSRHDMIRFTPGLWTPEGWYPLYLPVERLFIERGWASIAAAPVAPMFIGMALSGTLCGGLVLILWSGWRRKGMMARKRPLSDYELDA